MIISFFCHQKDMEGTGYTKIYIFTKLPDSKVWISEYVVLLWYLLLFKNSAPVTQQDISEYSLKVFNCKHMIISTNWLSPDTLWNSTSLIMQVLQH